MPSKLLRDAMLPLAFAVLMVVYAFVLIGKKSPVTPPAAEPTVAPVQAVTVQPEPVTPPVAETMVTLLAAHVRSWGTQLKKAPTESSDTVLELGGYRDVSVVIGASDAAQWMKIRTSAGAEGYVRADDLAFGSGLSGYQRECHNSDLSRPQSGEVVAGALTGDHILEVSGLPGEDAVITLESKDRSSGLAVYIRAGEKARVTGVAADDYVLSYSSGRQYAPSCGLFTVDARFFEEAASLNLRSDTRSETVTLTLRERNHPSA